MADLLDAFDDLSTDLRQIADAERAPAMAAYMKDHFEFLGVASPARKSAQKPLLRAARAYVIDDVLDVADRCWAADEREFQYVGADLLRAQANRLRPGDLHRLRTLVTSKSWWDTVDALAAHPVGTIVADHRELQSTMDEWIESENMWLARTAILHQLRWRAETDERRLFGYAERRAADTEFFIRKAIGWALREYAKIAPDAVRAFVQSHEHELSGLTRREALKHL